MTAVPVKPHVGDARAALAEAWQGRLPSRYDTPEVQRQTFEQRLAALLRPDMAILDVGSGATPTLAPEDRPRGCHYAGLDISLAELQKAPTGSYDEAVAADVTVRRPELEDRFDLIVSWQLFEHIRPLDTAFDNLRSYLRPGGHLLAKFSGSFSVFGLAHRVVPQPVVVWLLQHLLATDPEKVFPTYYDHCWDSALRRALASWSAVEIVPEYFGAWYTRFSRPLTALYVGYEEWARSAGRANLATHYVVNAVR